MRSCLVVKGGRDLSGTVSAAGSESLTRRQDVGLFVRDADGALTRVPGVVAMTLRVCGRRTTALLEVDVEDVDVTGLWLEEIRRG